MKRFTLCSVVCMLLGAGLYAQKGKPDHQLLWKISSPDVEQASYIYGTMHLRDPRVFNLSDSLFLRIEACKHFALEVHPDTMTKTMIVDPFNAAFNKRIEDELEEEEEKELNEEIKENAGIDASGLSRENRDLLPYFAQKVFKKDQDKNTFLDAHLYHVAKILGRNIIGLESIDDHKIALETFMEEGVPDVNTLVKQRPDLWDEFIGMYEAGDIEALFAYGDYATDSVLARRNEVMVQSSLEFIQDSGLFMAVGAAHLPGERGMVNLLRRKGYKVEPVKVRFSGEVIRAELLEKELEWVEESYPEEGFSISLPDNSYSYRSGATAGIMNVRSYPDLGLGHFFMYSVNPIVRTEITAEAFAEIMDENMKGNDTAAFVAQDYAEVYTNYRYMDEEDWQETMAEMKADYQHPKGLGIESGAQQGCSRISLIVCYLFDAELVEQISKEKISTFLNRAMLPDTNVENCIYKKGLEIAQVLFVSYQIQASAWLTSNPNGSWIIRH